MNLAKLLARGMARFGKPIGVRACTLTLSTATNRTVAEENAGTNPTSTDYRARGWLEESTSTALVAGQQVRQLKTKISLLGASIQGGAVPVKGAKIRFDGITYHVTEVAGDGVTGTASGTKAAVWECTCVK